VSISSRSAPAARASVTASKASAAASAPVSARDHRRVGAIAPDLELLDRGGAEGIAGRQHHLVALGAVEMRELAEWWSSCRLPLTPTTKHDMRLARGIDH